MTIIKALYENSIKFPDRLAVACSDGDLSYKELWEYVNKFASYLKKQGLKNGDAVVIQGVQNAAFIVILYGTLLSGGVVVPVDKNIKHDNMSDIINSTKSTIVFSNETLSDYSLSAILKLISDISLCEHTFPDEDDISDILYTTGTTGTPEGIIHTNKSHYATVENIFSTIKMPEHNTALIAAPLNHSFALRRFYANTVHGSSIIIIDNIMPLVHFFSILDKYNVTSIAMNPSALAIILKGSGNKIAGYYNQLNYIEFSSSPLKIDLLKEIINMLPNTKMYNIYGSTEAGCMTGYDNAEYLEQTGNIGHANINSDIYILDDDYNIIYGFGKDNAGFLAVKGPIVMQGYLNNKRNTEKVLKNGYYITQDIVYKDKDNFYHLVGRQSDIISIGGLKVAPDEIEDVIKNYPGITDCACVGKNDNIAGQVPVLFITVNEEYNGAEIYKFIKDKLEPYKCPKDIRIIEEIPKTFNGKILRRKLREML